VTTSLGITLSVRSARVKNRRAAVASVRAERHVDNLAVLIDGPVDVAPHAVDLHGWVGRAARCLLCRSFSVRPPAEPDGLVSEHPALQ
jgi:hypothetical protein